MSTLAPVIDRRTSDGGAAFIAYLTTGFPDLDTSVEAARALIDAGADAIELGLPYSDPVMDGAMIQHSGQAALDAGARDRLVGVVLRTQNGGLGLEAGAILGGLAGGVGGCALGAQLGESLDRHVLAHNLCLLCGHRFNLPT